MASTTPAASVPIISTQDIENHCREQLAAYKVPREIQIVPDLPTTSTGKILRRELHTLDEQE